MNIVGQFISKHIDFSVCRVPPMSRVQSQVNVHVCAVLLLPSLYGSYQHK